MLIDMEVMKRRFCRREPECVDLGDGRMMLLYRNGPCTVNLTNETCSLGCADFDCEHIRDARAFARGAETIEITADYA